MTFALTMLLLYATSFYVCVAILLIQMEREYRKEYYWKEGPRRGYWQYFFWPAIVLFRWEKK